MPAVAAASAMAVSMLSASARVRDVKSRVFSMICWYTDGAGTDMMTWRSVESMRASREAERMRSTSHFSASSSDMCSLEASMLQTEESGGGEVAECE